MIEDHRAIAIVGIGCRYPDASSPQELWENVLSQRRAFRRIPRERLRLDDFFSEGGEPDTIYSTEAAVIEGYEFDRLRFKIGERAFRSADLTHWVALDVASRALEDAGFADGRGLDGDGTGVLLGNTLTGEFSRAALMRLRWPYVRRQVAAALAAEGWKAESSAAFLERLEVAYKEPFPVTNEETLAGGLSNTIAGRICNHYDFHGGGYTVDGACASSLLAVANACAALAAGDLDVALAGGVDLSLDPFELVGFARTGALVAGEMRVFDRGSAGFVPGEGCGFVVLMRYRDALERGCRIYAVVRGWGISSDGCGGLTRPEAAGQGLALRRAYRRTDFGIDTVGLFEGHGTGTAVGDATELAALNHARRTAGGSQQAAIGSIKGNIGHTKAAAGVAGLIKASLALHHRLLPPTTGCQDPHPELCGEGAALRVLHQPEPWPDDVPLRAGVSAMGFGGINCHLVLDAEDDRRRRSLTTAERRLSVSSQDAELFLLAESDTAALAALVERLLRRAGGLSRAELADLAAELADSQRPKSVRAAVVAATPRELADRLEILGERLAAGFDGNLIDLEAAVFAGSAHRPPRVGFLFPGQGSPAHLCGGRWRRRFAAVERLYREADFARDGDSVETAVAQPAIVTAILAALVVLDRLGVDAKVALGHSLGELVALHWMEAFDRATLLRLASARGQAMSELGDGDGAMASLGTGAAQVEDLLATLDLEAVTITGYNSPSQTVISGSSREIDAVVAEARAQKYKALRLAVSHAFHSPLVAAAVPRFEEVVQREQIAALANTSRRRICSTFTGGWLAHDEDVRQLLCRQITSPTRFMDAFGQAAPEADLFLEVGPGEVLTGLARQQTDVPVIALDAGGDSLRGLLRAAGALFAMGAPLDAKALFADRFTRPIDLEKEPSFFVNPCELAPLDGAKPGPPIVAAESDREPEVVVEAVSPPKASSPLALVRELIAHRAELSPAAITPDSRMLSDLHLSSIAVGEVITQAALRLDLPPPFAPTEYADATVDEVAKALEEMAGGGGREQRAEALPAGLESWVRAFTVERIERPQPPPRTNPEPRPWRIIAAPEHPMRQALELAFADAGRGGVVLCLGPEDEDGHPSDAMVDQVLEASRAALADRTGPLVLVQQGAGAVAFVRALHLEAPEIPVAVVALPPELGEDQELWARRVVAEALAVRRYSEARYDLQGRRFRPMLRPRLEAGAEDPAVPAAATLTAGEVLLVTGGGKGIGAECALALARRTGTQLALIGRSRPEEDSELSANLERFRHQGVTFRYLSADVTDGEAVSTAVAEVERELGPVRAVLHGAGVNKPQLISALERADVTATLAPKVSGLRNVLAAVDPQQLRLLIGFGSIIGRSGLRGEADYALANDWLRRAIERFADRHPDCLCRCLEWSVWSGIGMGARLGRLEALTAEGVTPISPEQGVAMLEELVFAPRPGDAVSMVVTGRFRELPTLEVEKPALPLYRFLEQPRVVFPGIELVVDCELSQDTDPYLADHMFEGQQLFPAVLGLEAMSQAAAALTGRAELPVFDEVRFDRPISVEPGGATTLRVAALVRSSGELEVALRSSRTAFQVDHFRARVQPAAAPESVVPVAEPNGHEMLPLSATDLYGPVLFQAGRFQRLQGYRELRATSCVANVAPSSGGVWFSPYLPAELLLGDPGARDAFIHCIQACIPHATVLPTAVELLTPGKIAGPGPYRVAACERSHQGRTLVYDFEVHDRDGNLVEQWLGLELRIVGHREQAPHWAPELLGPYLQRRFRDLVPGPALAVAVDRNGHDDRPKRGRHALGRALGFAVEISHRPDGKPEVEGQDVSIAHSGELVMAVAGHGTVGCDLQPVESRGSELWDDLLGSHRRELLDYLIRERGEDRDTAATRIWTVLESLRKAGYLNDAPVRYASATDDGWVLFDCGRQTAATALLTPTGCEHPFSFAVLADREPSEEKHA